MIKADHQKWARVIFNPVIKGLLRSHFDHFYSVSVPPFIPADEGLLVLPNHFSWWDGFFIYQLLSKMKNRRFNLMMLEKQLSRYWYFRHIGAYSVNPGHPKSVMESLRYTTALLDDPAQLAVVYPQGEIETYYKRPLTLEPGILHALKKTGGKVNVLPVFFRIEYFESRKPDIWFGYGRLKKKADVIGNFSAYCKNFNEEIEEFDNKVDQRDYRADCFKNKNTGEWKIENGF